MHAQLISPILFNPMDCSLLGSPVHGIFQAKYWSRLSFPPPRDLPNPWMELTSPALAGRFLTTEPPGVSP